MEDPDATLKSNLRTAQFAMETYATENDGSYSRATAAVLQEIEPDVVDDIELSDLSADTYHISIKQNGATYAISRENNGKITRTCSGGSCIDGVW